MPIANSFSKLIFDFSYGNFFWNFCFVCFSFHFANHSTYLRSKCIRTLRVNLTNAYGIIIQFQSSKCIWIEFSFRNIILYYQRQKLQKKVWNLWMILYGLFSIYHRRKFSNHGFKPTPIVGRIHEAVSTIESILLGSSRDFHHQWNFMLWHFLWHLKCLI